jgi:purine-binding chemotaxis protein CheW
MSDDPVREFIGFQLGGEFFALPIEGVREIAKVTPITEVPRAPRELLGIASRRGEVLPVYDLRPRLGLAAAPLPRSDDGTLSEPSPSGRLVVLRDGAEAAAILADVVVEVLRLKESTLEPPQPGARPLVVGTGRRGERSYQLLDPSGLLP